MLVHGVHGWGETDKGAGSVGQLRPYIDSTDRVYLIHEHFWPSLRSWALLQQRRRTREEADAFAKKLRHGDAVICYSNGAAVARRAIEQSGAIVPLWIIIAGALPVEFEVPPSVKKVIVLHSRRDRILWLAKLWTIVNPVSWFLGHDWGMLGRVGYAGDDERVHNWPGREHAPRHVGWFDEESLIVWGPRIAEAIKRV